MTTSTRILRLITLATFIFPVFLNAFEKTSTDKKIQGITLSDTVTLSELGTGPFKSVAQGLRKKPVAILNIKVYVGELLLPAATTWDKKASTFEGAADAGVMMTFLRDVPAKNIAEAFVDGLKENEAAIESSEVKAFLEAVKKLGNIKENDIFVIARSKKKDGDHVLVLIPNRPHEIIKGPAGWSDQILKIWSGKPSDKGVRELQKAFFN